MESLISSKTRIKLLLKFFLHEGSSGYLRGLEAEFGESSNAIRLELNRLVNAGFLSSHAEGNKRIFNANVEHPLYSNLRQLVRKHVGIDRLLETIVAQLGELNAVYLTGGFARGLDTGAVELLLVGSDIDLAYLEKLIIHAQSIIGRPVRYELRALSLASSEQDGRDSLALLLWEREITLSK